MDQRNKVARFLESQGKYFFFFFFFFFFFLKKKKKKLKDIINIINID